MIRRTLLFVLMINLLFFAGCADNGAEERFAAFREETAAAATVCTAQLCADYGEAVYEFTLRCAGTPGDCTVEVLSPESVAGIRAHLKGNSSRLEFEDIILDTGDLTADGLTPVSALPTVLSAAAEGHVQRLWEADDYLAAEIYLNDADTLTLWLDGSNKPTAAEIASGGVLVVSCRFTQWQSEG